MWEIFKTMAQHFETQVGPVGAIFMFFTVALALEYRSVTRDIVKSIPKRIETDTLISTNMTRLVSMVEILAYKK